MWFGKQKFDVSNGASDWDKNKSETFFINRKKHMLLILNSLLEQFYCTMCSKKYLTSYWFGESVASEGSEWYQTDTK